MATEFKLPYNKKPGHVPLLYSGGIYTAKGNRIFVFQENQKPVLIGKFKDRFLLNSLSKFSITRRILRLGFTYLNQLNDGSLIGIVRKNIVLKKNNWGSFKSIFKIKRGSRPLNLCVTPSGDIYFGEYFGNSERDEVYIYKCYDSTNFRVIYTFPKNRIRHIHGLFWDDIRKGIWILTGDLDAESGLWFSHDGCQTLTPIISGSQQSRAVSIIPLKGGLIVPMDTPQETNYIQYFDLADNSFTKLQKLPGSAFNSFFDGQISMISTVLEPSEVNTKDYISVYASLDQINFKEIFRLQADIYSKFSFKYFRYPEVTFAHEREKSQFVYMYMRATNRYNNQMLVLKKEDIVKYLN